MDIYSILTVIVSFAALLGYFNSRYIHMPTTIAIMSGSLVFSMVLIIVGQFGFHSLEQQIAGHLGRIDFHALLIQGMLSYLLFAGALTIDISSLRQRKWEIAVLASFSTITSTVLIGGAVYYFLHAVHIDMPFIYCLLFGALISPTDPIAVLAIFKDVKASKELNVTVSGESLFNDGVAIVVFLTLYQVAFSSQAPTFNSVLSLFLQQAVGGIAYGICLGLVGYQLIRNLDDYKVEILITLAMVTGGYTLATYLGVSGPLAMVVSGIFIGNKGRQFAMSRAIRNNLENFWELIDEILNAVLFFLMGLELLVIEHDVHHIFIGLAAIAIVLAIRFITVAIPISLFKLKRTYSPYFISILVWGGLRGGLAVALALALPASPYRSIIMTMTYAIVVFSVIVQGLTVKPLVQKSQRKARA